MARRRPPLTEISRLAHHLPIYVAPTTQYTPYIYAPLFFWFSALAARVTGLTFAAGRAVSIVSTLAIFAGIFLFILAESPRKSSARILAAVFGVGIFAAAYPITAGFLDVGRVDMLCLAFAVFALVSVRRGHLLLAAFLFALAVQTKQGILPIAILALCTDWQRPRRLALGLSALAVFCAVPVVWLNHATQGWYSTYVFKVAGGFAVNWRVFEFYFPGEIFPITGIVLTIILAAFLLRPRRPLDRSTSFYALTALGMVLFTGYVRAHAGAAGNADLPLLLWVAFTGGVAFQRLYARFQPSTPALILLLATALVYLIPFLHGPAFLVPSQAERISRDTFLRQLRAIPGDVLMLDHPYLDELAGKPNHADGKAIDGLVTSPHLPYGAQLKAELAAQVRDRRFTAIVEDGSLQSALTDDRLPPGFALSLYPVRAALMTNDHQESPTQPAWLFFPCPSSTFADPHTLLPGVLIDDSRCNLAQQSQSR